MSLKPKSEVDMSGLAEQVRRAQAVTKKKPPEIVNQRLMNVGGRASNKTRMAEKAQIQQELGVIARAVKVTKKGKLVRGKRIYAPSQKSAPLSALIINKRRGKAGKKGLRGKEMEQAVRRMIGARERSTGFGRSGFFPGIKTLAGTQKKPFIIAQMKGISVKGQPKGRAVPAPANSLNPVGILENSVKGITKIGEQAFQEAIRDETAEMKRHVDEAMLREFNQINQLK